jgi:hypothetical protein
VFALVVKPESGDNSSYIMTIEYPATLNMLVIVLRLGFGKVGGIFYSYCKHPITRLMIITMLGILHVK